MAGLVKKTTYQTSGKETSLMTSQDNDIMGRWWRHRPIFMAIASRQKQIMRL